MKYFLKKLFLYVLLLISFIGLFFIINEILITKNELLTIESQKNKLIIGASRTANAINDKYLEGSLNLSGAGDPLFYSFIKIRTFKKNNPNIDTIILSLDNRTLNSKNVNRFYRPVSLESKLPNYFNLLSTDDFKQVFNINMYSTFKATLFIPKYTLKLIRNIILKPNNNKNLNIGGYIEVKHVVNQDVIDNFKLNDNFKKYNLSEIEIETLKRIVDFCKLNNIELIFINPPMHPVMYNSMEYQEGKVIFDNFLIANYPNHTYLDFSNHFLPESCYADLIHLNKSGAEIFTKKLNQLLKTSNKLKN